MVNYKAMEKICQTGIYQVSETNKLSGNVAHDLSGWDEYNGYHGGGIHETDRIVTGDPENEI
jgi:hypothetical protein